MSDPHPWASSLDGLLALWLLFAASGTVCADTLHGVVIVAIDGDTVLFKPDHYPPGSRAFLKVRLADIDAPDRIQERVHPEVDMKELMLAFAA
ncbi:MAG: hypothetical protein B7X55_04385, partial [Rhodobacterales bacterium 34-62-10]